jgi:peptidyl-prolyl cis-trans isomerase C
MTACPESRSSARLIRLSTALLMSLSLSVLSLGAIAQETPPANATTEAPATPDPNAVVATVGTETITEADLSFAAEDLAQDLANVAPEERRAFLLTVLIDMKVMAQAARSEGMDQTELFQQRLNYLEERALRRAYFAEKISSAVTPEALQAAYDAYVATFQPQEEIHARHILVDTQEEAAAIKAEIEGGRPFDEVAREKSKDPSAATNGGDLGFFGRGMMVPEFENAAFALTEIGQISDPIQSQYGWHIIQLEERRESSPPTIDQIAPQLQQQVLFDQFDSIVSGLKADLTIDIPDPVLNLQVQAQTEMESQ